MIQDVLQICNGSKESENVRTTSENVRTKLIMYGHYVCTLLNPYFKLCNFSAHVCVLFLNRGMARNM